MNEGEIVSIIGPVVDVDFSGGSAPQDGTAAQDGAVTNGKSSGLPKILNALRIPRKNFEGKDEDLICEVQQHLG
ncbi:MAG TPA: hypothetical protein VFD13_06300, partial [Candidatus Kapabacteria bacterium]|nr:hypothetical protein [Candidatus Kapabacteria bacterium]